MGAPCSTNQRKPGTGSIVSRRRGGGIGWEAWTPSVAGAGSQRLGRYDFRHHAVRALDAWLVANGKECAA